MMPSLSPDSGYHLVFCAFPAYGHVRPLRRLATHLSSLGYSATFVTSDYFQSSIESIPNVDFLSFDGKVNCSPDNILDHFPERSNQPQDETIAIWDVQEVFFGTMDEQFTALQTVLARPSLVDKKVVLLTDGFLTGALPISLDTPLARRVPVIAIANFPMLSLSRDTAPFGFGLASQGWDKNEKLNEQVVQMFADAHKVCKEKLQKYDCRRSIEVRTPMDYMFHTPEAYLQLSVPEMEYPRSDMPEQVSFVGTLLGGNDDKGTPTWWDEFVVKGSKPLVVVTSGTVPSMSSDELIIPTIEACRDLPVRLVVCAVHATLPESFNLPSNVRVASWLPFEELFKYASIVVANGGYGGVNQAFASGLPMVLAGLTEDKIEVTARAAMTGAAINLKTQTPTAEQVKDALRRLLREESFENRARELQKSYAKFDTVGLIERKFVELAEEFYR